METEITFETLKKAYYQPPHVILEGFDIVLSDTKTSDAEKVNRCKKYLQMFKSIIETFEKGEVQ